MNAQTVADKLNQSGMAGEFPRHPPSDRPMKHRPSPPNQDGLESAQPDHQSMF
jgi:hypothetical protein